MPNVPPHTQTMHNAVPRRRLLGSVLGAAGAAMLTRSSAHAGSLSPPPGPVAPTGKPLSELEPRIALSAANTPGDASTVFFIAEPGSYYLVANLTLAANMTAIRVLAPDVEIDLNGFTISGGGVSGTSGIAATFSGARNLSIRNGTIERMDSHGIAIFDDGPTLLTDLVLRSNRGYGVILGQWARLERVVAVDNAAGVSSSPAGIVLGSDSMLIACTAASNQGKGFIANVNTLFIDCIATANTADGIAGALDDVLIGCACSFNGGAGITLQHSGVIESCSAHSNTGVGISGSFGSNVRNSSAVQNVAGGISLWEGSLVANSVVRANGAAGIVLNTGSIAARCQAIANTAVGINAGSATGSLITSCGVYGNFDGIVVGPGCLVRENQCDSNFSIPGNSEIRVTGVASYLDGNVSAHGGLGMWVTATKTLIVRNNCTDNQTNWNITSNCVYGPVVNRVGAATSGMGGNGTAPSTLASSDPFANFSF